MVVAKVQFDINTYTYFPQTESNAIASTTRTNRLSFSAILSNATQNQLEWKKNNLITSIAIGIMASSLFLLGAFGVIGGFLKATFTFSASPLLWCPVGIVLMGVTIATVWKSKWICNGIETYFLPHLLKALLNSKIEKSRNFIGLYSLFAGTNDPRLTKSPYLTELQAIISLNLALSTMSKACETEDPKIKESLINNSQELAKNIDTTLPFFQEHRGLRNLIVSMGNKPVKVMEILKNAKENTQLADVISRVS